MLLLPGLQFCWGGGTCLPLLHDWSNDKNHKTLISLVWVILSFPAQTIWRPYVTQVERRVTPKEPCSHTPMWWLLARPRTCLGSLEPDAGM